jgi:two-component system LytT family response regulator
MKFRTVLVDDERLALDRLERLLAAHRDTIDVVGSAENGADAIVLINQRKPDLVFLDIQMPELTGFDVLERLDYMPLVIFSTAYDQYALQAFEVHSVDYLLKPVDPDRLQQAVGKLQRLANSGLGVLRDRVQEAVQMLQSSHRGRIQVKVGDRIRFIPVAEVAFFQARDKYVEVHTSDRTYLITKSLINLEAELPESDFVRVHRSVIVNIEFIDEITRDVGGGYEVRMKDADKTRLPVSRRYRSRLDLR